MEDLLTILEKWLKENRPEFFKSLLRGRTEEQLQALEEKLGVKLPDDFKTLYAWRGGQSDGDPYSSFDLSYASFMSCQDVVGMWKLLKKITRSIMYRTTVSKPGMTSGFPS